jgi:Fe-S cluster assembly ATPase SufC
MGPNGAGKSTLAKVLAGHPAYEITSGENFFEGQNINELNPEERAKPWTFHELPISVRDSRRYEYAISSCSL